MNSMELKDKLKNISKEKDMDVDLISELTKLSRNEINKLK